jgi:hypothetical protein
MSQDDRPPPKWFDDNDPAKMRPIDRHAALGAADTAEVVVRANIMESRAKLMRIALGWMLLGAAKNIEHAGASLVGIHDDEDRDSLNNQLRGLYRMAMQTINQIRVLYGCDPISAELPPVKRQGVEHADR